MGGRGVRRRSPTGYQGVPIPVVSQRLGHTNVMMTMRVYGHVLPAQDHAAAAAIGRALAGS